MQPANPTAKGHFDAALFSVLPASQPLALAGSHLIGPFDNADLAGLFTECPPEREVDFRASYPGKAGAVAWRSAPGLDGAHQVAVSLVPWFPAEPRSVVYYYGEVVIEEAAAQAPVLARLSVVSAGFVQVWVNGALVVKPTIPEPANGQDHAAWVALKPGANTVLVKLIFMGADQNLGLFVQSHGPASGVWRAVRNLVETTTDPGVRLNARMTLAEMLAVAATPDECRLALAEVRRDPVSYTHLTLPTIYSV